MLYLISLVKFSLLFTSFSYNPCIIISLWFFVQSRVETCVILWIFTLKIYFERATGYLLEIEELVILYLKTTLVKFSLLVIYKFNLLVIYKSMLVINLWIFVDI